jgi:putative tryptophan/tyrosine transport system substrate-binding protein
VASHIGRRKFLATLGGAAATWPLAAHAQQPAMPVIGFLSSILLEETGIAAFRQGLSESGYLEGRNVSVQYRHADGNYDRLASLAAELVSLPVTLIVAVPSTPAALAAKEATSTIPIVFFSGADPVRLRLVASYNRPGGNVTGIVLNSDEVTAKRVELLHEVLPTSVPIALLVNRSNPSVNYLIRNTQEAARTVHRELIVVGATTKGEIAAAFGAIVRQRAGGLVVWQEAYFTSKYMLIVDLAARHAIPAIYGPRHFPENGGLMSYGANRDEMYRLTGGYAGKILHGTKPADLPVIQPTRFELVINLKTAKALGLQIPDKLLALANEVIE